MHSRLHRLDALVHLRGERGERATLGGVASVTIDDGVSKGTIEPGDHGFLVTQRVRSFERVLERCVDQVLGEGAIADATLDETDELRATGRESWQRAIPRRLPNPSRRRFAF